MCSSRSSHISTALSNSVSPTAPDAVMDNVRGASLSPVPLPVSHTFTPVSRCTWSAFRLLSPRMRSFHGKSSSTPSVAMGISCTRAAASSAPFLPLPLPLLGRAALIGPKASKLSPLLPLSLSLPFPLSFPLSLSFPFSFPLSLSLPLRRGMSKSWPPSPLISRSSSLAILSGSPIANRSSWVTVARLATSSYQFCLSCSICGDTSSGRRPRFRATLLSAASTLPPPFIAA
mmetsp:Transcript_69503/g.181069  ORF Transcript_69503/g.181069 Transcript_69503/m.181069 type:complete len:231 (+) Transcript_69503:278-970(+)